MLQSVNKDDVTQNLSDGKTRFQTGFAYHMLFSFAHRFVLYQKELVLFSNATFLDTWHCKISEGEITQHRKQWED